VEETVVVESDIMRARHGRTVAFREYAGSSKTKPKTNDERRIKFLFFINLARCLIVFVQEPDEGVLTGRPLLFLSISN